MSTKLVHGKYLVTDADNVIPSGAVVIQDDEIVGVGTYEDLKRDFDVEEVLGSSECLVIPGFINAHGHGKGVTDFQLGSIDNTLETWKFRSYPRFDIYYDTLWRSIKLLESGVTTTMHNHNLVQSDRYYEEFSTALKAYIESGIRVAFAPTLKDQKRNVFIYGDNEEFIRSLPSSLRTRIEQHLQKGSAFGDKEYFEAVRRLREEFQSTHVKIMHGPLSPQWCTDESLVEVKKSADEMGMRIHMHVLQTLMQKTYGLKAYGKSLLEHLFDLGFLGQNVTCGHSVWLTERDIDLLRDTGTSVTTHASCNLRVRNGICPVFALLQKGVTVGIGIDDKGLSDDKDFIEEMRLVSKLHRIPSHHLHSEHLLPKDSFRMGTLYGAEVLGFADMVGTIEKGKKADIVLIDLTRITEPYLYPGHSIIDALIYRGRSSDVDTVLVGGEILVRNGKFTKIDRAEVIRKLRESVPSEYPEDVIRKREMFDELRPHIAKYFDRWFKDIDSRGLEPYYVLNSKD